MRIFMFQLFVFELDARPAVHLPQYSCPVFPLVFWLGAPFCWTNLRIAQLQLQTTVGLFKDPAGRFFKYPAIDFPLSPKEGKRKKRTLRGISDTCPLWAPHPKSRWRYFLPLFYRKNLPTGGQADELALRTWSLSVWF
jgi:hypothetical protein